MQADPYVFLVPGFFGFERVGGLTYFRDVGEALARAYGDLGITPTITSIETLPTSSLRERAAHLARAIRDRVTADGRPIHLVAHSSGGLDARLLLTPGAALPIDFALEPIAMRVRSLVTVATPHHGTPLASFFHGMFGQHLLWVCALCAVHGMRFGGVPIRALGGIATSLRGTSRAQTAREREAADATLTHVRRELLDALPTDRRGALERMLTGMEADQALLLQLTPEAIEPLAAATGDRPGVRYGCVVARAPRPGLGSVIRVGPRPHAQAMHALYSTLYQLAGRMPRSRALLVEQTKIDALSATFRSPITWEDSDGIVPTLSQIWGDVVVAVDADHLDVVGHFDEPRSARGLGDWLVSASGFDRRAFERLWADVARFAAIRVAPRPLVARVRAWPIRRPLGVALGVTVAFAINEALERAGHTGSLLTSFAAFVFALGLGASAYVALTRRA